MSRATGSGEPSVRRPCPCWGPGKGELTIRFPFTWLPIQVSSPPGASPMRLAVVHQPLDCVFRPSDRRGPGRDPGAAMCVQGIDVQCVLQFTLINAAGCALHRCTSRVIHRSELSFPFHGHHQGRPAPTGGQHFTLPTVRSQTPALTDPGGAEGRDRLLSCPDPPRAVSRCHPLGCCTASFPCRPKGERANIPQNFLSLPIHSVVGSPHRVPGSTPGTPQTFQPLC